MFDVAIGAVVHLGFSAQTALRRAIAKARATSAPPRAEAEDGARPWRERRRRAQHGRPAQEAARSASPRANRSSASSAAIFATPSRSESKRLDDDDDPPEDDADERRCVRARAPAPARRRPGRPSALVRSPAAAPRAKPRARCSKTRTASSCRPSSLLAEAQAQGPEPRARAGTAGGHGPQASKACWPISASRATSSMSAPARW